MDFAERIFAFLAAIAPACLIATMLVAIGKRTLPPGVRSLALLMGPFAALSSLLSFPFVAAIALLHPPGASLLNAFFAAAMPEELAKFAVLTTIVLRHYDAETRRDAILAGAWLGIGFGVFENFFYVTDGKDWMTVGLLRAVTSVPFHVALGAIMGLGLQRDVRRRWVFALLAPIALHGLYDWPAMAVAWDKAALNPTTLAYGVVFLGTLALTGYLVAAPIARALRAMARDPAMRRSAPANATFLLGLDGLALLLRIGALIAVGVGVVAGIVVDTRYVALLAPAILPFTFAELWRTSQS